MLPSAPGADPESSGEALAHVAAGEYPTAAEGFDHGLVVLALGRPYWLIPTEGRFCLRVQPEDLAVVQAELAHYDRESVGWPPAPAAEPRASRRGPWFASLLWALGVVLVFGAETLWPGRWQAAGDLDARALFQGGEWWRPATALFLHADAEHLISNLISGFFVLGAVLSILGLVRGGLLLAAASVLGNFAVAAAYYPQPYESLGASTGIFAGLGLLTGRAMRSIGPAPRGRRWRSVWVPLGSGLTLLGLYGAGEDRTDVAAHLAGFAAGWLLGLVAGFRGPPPPAA